MSTMLGCVLRINFIFNRLVTRRQQVTLNLDTMKGQPKLRSLDYRQKCATKCFPNTFAPLHFKFHDTLYKLPVISRQQQSTLVVKPDKKGVHVCTVCFNKTNTLLVIHNYQTKFGRH